MPLAVPTLTLVDNEDDTGCVATIAGATAGTTNDVYAAPWHGGFVPAAFASYGSRSGNGAVALALAAGYWWAYVLSTLAGESAISLVGGIRVTTGDLSIFEQCLDGIVAKLQTLTLPSPWESAAVVKQKVPWNRGMVSLTKDASIFVTPQSEQLTPILNTADDFGEGVQVTLVRKGNQHLTENLSAELRCRQQVANALLPAHGEQALPGVPDIYDVRIEPGPVLDAGAFQAQYDVGALVVRCLNRRSRGLV